MANILLVEDDEALNRGISFKLKKEGYNVFKVAYLMEARKIIHSENIDLVLLDVNLPDGNGFEFCNEIRNINNNILVIFLTVCDQEVDIVTGYDIGADDYITKPFSLMVLMLKVKAVLRRKVKVRSKKIIFSGDIVFHDEELKVFKSDKELFLSKTEFKLLKCLICNYNQIVTKDQILNELWDIDGNFINENTLAVNIRRLREKIEDDPSKPKYIKNIRGIGYTWGQGCKLND
ncbi:response regulator transcription factor [Clostridium brassicae]|uniref:Stage 0 sporulation protein A homolog n=1 Tax=Clostridium brassicae TaxID=2999072 RepID=A0ABT4D8A0_9CLOT|nr:response regulator transcription factor [Clostridium brassicae]MCY6958524.1 response regulator transcription factor [Clostridium brassicae]